MNQINLMNFVKNLDPQHRSNLSNIKTLKKQIEYLTFISDTNKIDFGISDRKSERIIKDLGEKVKRLVDEGKIKITGFDKNGLIKIKKL